MGRPAQDRAEAILDAARAQFLLSGVEGATVDDIAARAGVGKGTIFLYWPTKTRLQEAVLLLEVARGFAVLVADLRDDPTLLRLGTVIRRQIAACLNNPDLAPLLINQFTVTSVPPEAPTRALHRIISTMRAYGLVRAVDPGQIVLGLEAVMAGAVIRGVAGPGDQADLLQAMEHLVSAAYDSDGVDRNAIDAALPEVLDALEDAIDQLVAAAAPDRPTTARLRPRERPAATRT